MNIRYCLLILIYVFFAAEAEAQNEASTWYFGDNAGLSFNGDTPTSLLNGRLQTVEGSTSISDRNGNLLFYTDGITVYNRNHSPMRNGDNLKGNVSSTQSAIVVPRPGNPSRYYIFTVDKPDYYLSAEDPLEGVNYSEVDMTLDSGRGAIIPGRKNIHLVTYNPSDPIENEFKSSEKISAVIGGDCVSYWVVTQFTNKFYSFRVSSEGVENAPVISAFSENFPPIINEIEVNITAGGYLKISPDGKKMAAAFSNSSLQNSGMGGSKKNGKVFLYDFDDLTGKVSNAQLLLENSYPYGVEFSPESTKVYVTANIFRENDVLDRSELYQFDLASPGIANSRTIIHSSRNVAGALQLAPDGRIYRAGYPTDDGGYLNHNFLSVINEPENAGANVNYAHNVVDVSPNDVKLGLPPFVQSLFRNNFEAANFCLGEPTEFSTSGDNYDAVEWDFGDGNLSSEENPSHTYSAPGSYTVSLTKSVNNIPQDPVCKEITIIGIPEAAQDYILTQCDTDGNPDDGLTGFNLQLARDYLTGNNNGISVLFYETERDATLDNLNREGLTDLYHNTSPNQELVAKVTGLDAECTTLTKIQLRTTAGVNIDAGTASGCDLGNGAAEFNLGNIAEDLRTELNLEESVSLTFHKTEDDAVLGANPLPNFYNAEAGTIYVKAYQEDVCYGYGSLNLEIQSFPNFQQNNILELCSSEFPLHLGKDLVLENPEDFSFEWNTGETTATIEINEPGNYNLNIINNSFGCGRTINFNVEELDAPEITNIQIDNNGAVSDVSIIANSNSSNLMFSLGNIDGPYQSSPDFRNIAGGRHTVYVRAENSCEIIAEEFTVFGFPNFFTPNNDGYNDRWKPYDLDNPEFTIRHIYIFDRYGKLLTQLNPDGAGWDGNFQGRAMPSDDYWFNIVFEDGTEIKGHFSLKRSN
ncbi:T9SS type B sorting domain-containing protein [Salegentibacter sp. F188]|uniref:T9SS type B sorting domain-containing protein n=1 Tax=Autumnicola patrickiae TaxID=3075591 RepID=A0ABU3DXR0_9FLAO|nr:T9SS type B sorting domain-containing protein [Salegentibacter sp. F188]MDT0688488.1 T9SS type B sorting domain-containing protein [Salegentibacter sp. F188]